MCCHFVQAKTWKPSWLFKFKIYLFILSFYNLAMNQIPTNYSKKISKRAALPYVPLSSIMSNPHLHHLHSTIGIYNWRLIISQDSSNIPLDILRRIFYNWTFLPIQEHPRYFTLSKTWTIIWINFLKASYARKLSQFLRPKIKFIFLTSSLKLDFVSSFGFWTINCQSVELCWKCQLADHWWWQTLTSSLYLTPILWWNGVESQYTFFFLACNMDFLSWQLRNVNSVKCRRWVLVLL